MFTRGGTGLELRGEVDVVACQARRHLHRLRRVLEGREAADLYSNGLYSCGLYSCRLYRCRLYRCGLYRCGLYRAALCATDTRHVAWGFVLWLWHHGTVGKLTILVMATY